MAAALYLWDRVKVHVMDPLTGGIIRQSVPTNGGADAFGCVLANGRVLLSTDVVLFNGDNSSADNPNVRPVGGAAYVISNPALTSWTFGPPVRRGVLPGGDWTFNTFLAVGGKLYAFAKTSDLEGQFFGQQDHLVEFRSLYDLTPVHVELLMYDVSDLAGDESSPEAPAIGPDTVCYTTEGGYTHAVNVNTWQQTRPIQILTDSAHYSENEDVVGTIDTDLQGSALDPTGRVWSYAYNEQNFNPGNFPDAWNLDEIQIFSGTGDNNWRLEWSGTPPTAELQRDDRGFSGTGAIIWPYYYLCPGAGIFIARFHLETQVMEWGWADLNPLLTQDGTFEDFILLAGGSNAGLQAVPGVHLANGVRHDPINEPRGARQAVRN